ncbi:hypothetical protein JCM10213v2_006492 [Rhodosporidiobolus nylandii]
MGDAFGFSIDPATGRASLASLFTPAPTPTASSSARQFAAPPKPAPKPAVLPSSIAGASTKKKSTHQRTASFGETAPVAARAIGWTSRRKGEGLFSLGPAFPTKEDDEKRAVGEAPEVVGGERPAEGPEAREKTASAFPPVELQGDGDGGFEVLPTTGSGKPHPAAAAPAAFSSVLSSYSASSSAHPSDLLAGLEEDLFPPSPLFSVSPLPNADNEDEGRQLLSQWTFVSPSPERKRARALGSLKGKERSATAAEADVRPECELGKSRAETVSGAELFSPPPHHPSPASFAPHLPLQPTVGPTSPRPVPAPSTITAAPSALGLSFDFSTPYTTPARPAKPQRHPSIGTALSGLSLASASEEDGAPSSSSPPSTVVPLEQQQYEAVKPAEEPKQSDTTALATSLAALLDKEKENLPASLVAVLSATLDASQSSDLGAVDALARKLGLLEGQGEGEPDDEEGEMDVPAPSLDMALDPPAHSRTTSLASTSSLRSIPASPPSGDAVPLTSSSLSLSQHRRSSSPPAPAKTHAPYPDGFSAPLRWVYENGLETFEEARETRARGMSVRGSPPPPAPSVLSKKGRSKGRGRSVSWASVVVKEEDEDEDMNLKEEEEGEEEEYVPRPTRSRATPVKKATAFALALTGQEPPAKKAKAQEDDPLLALLDELADDGVEEREGWVRRSKRARRGGR